MEDKAVKTCPSCGAIDGGGRYCASCGQDLEGMRSFAAFVEKLLRANGYSDLGEIAGRENKFGTLARAFAAAFADVPPGEVLVFTGTMRHREFPLSADVVILRVARNEEAWRMNAIASAAADAFLAAQQSANLRIRILTTLYAFYEDGLPEATRRLHAQASRRPGWRNRPGVKIVGVDLAALRKHGTSDSVADAYVEAAVNHVRFAKGGLPPAAPDAGLAGGFLSENLSAFSRILRELRVALHPELIAHRIHTGSLGGTQLAAIVGGSATISIAIDKLFGIDAFGFDMPVVGEALKAALFYAVWILLGLTFHPFLKLFRGRAALRHTVVAVVYVSAIIAPISVFLSDVSESLTGEPNFASGNVAAVYFLPVLAAVHDMRRGRTFLAFLLWLGIFIVLLTLIFGAAQG
jgi:hypothetical protein